MLHLARTSRNGTSFLRCGPSWEGAALLVCFAAVTAWPQCTGLHGDVDGTGFVSNLDALMISSSFLGLLDGFPADSNGDGRWPESFCTPTPAENRLAAAVDGPCTGLHGDVDGNEFVTNLDALMVASAFLGLLGTFPADANGDGLWPEAFCTPTPVPTDTPSDTPTASPTPTATDTVEPFPAGLCFGDAVVAMDGSAPFVSADGLELFFSRGSTTGMSSAADLYRAVRSATDEPFGAAQPLAELNMLYYYETYPALSPDGLTLYFLTNRAMGWGYLGDVAMARRPRVGAPFGPVQIVDSLNSGYNDIFGGVTADGKLAVLARGTGNEPAQLYYATRSSAAVDWQRVYKIYEFHDYGCEHGRPWISPDGLFLAFARRPADSTEAFDLFYATRSTRADFFSMPVPLDVNTAAGEMDPSFTDGFGSLYFRAVRPDGSGVYCAGRADCGYPTATPTGTPTDTPTGTWTPAPTDTPAPRLAVGLPGDVTMEFVLVPAGSFAMGAVDPGWSNSNLEEPVHTVTFAEPFYMQATEVTAAQFAAYLRATGDDEAVWWDSGICPLRREGGDYVLSGGTAGTSWDQAMISVEWYGMKGFAEWVSAVAGVGFGLPSEAQWEYACRAGSTTRFHFGDTTCPPTATTCPELDAYAWWEGSRIGGAPLDASQPVGQRVPNAWGLYDLHGNAWEWCEDTLHTGYAGAPTDGSAWLGGIHPEWRMIRGGTWTSELDDCTSYHRDARLAVSSGNGLAGGRLVRAVRP